MNMTLHDDDPLNTTLLHPNGEPLYFIRTPRMPFGGSDTIISRLNSQGKRVPVACIQWKSWPETLLLWYVNPQTNLLLSPDIFQASNKKLYKWTISGGYPLLTQNEDAEERIAIYTPSSSLFSFSSYPASLSVVQAGLPILDDIVTTFVFIEHRRRERKHKDVHSSGLPAV